MSVTLPDFDTLKQLAEEDPESFEQLRQAKINELIDYAPTAYRQRLLGLQFQIDGQRRTAKNPTQACIRISNMMHESFHLLRKKLQELAQGSLYEPTLDEEFERIESGGAQIIPFPKKA